MAEGSLAHLMAKASVLLAIHCKKAEPVDLEKALGAYVQKNYSLAPETKEDLATLQSLRAEALRQTSSAVRVSELRCKRSLVCYRFAPASLPS